MVPFSAIATDGMAAFTGPAVMRISGPNVMAPRESSCPPLHSQLIDPACVKGSVNINHIARLGVDRRVINATEQRVDGAELRRRLRAVGVGDDNPRRASIEAPCQAAIGRALSI